MKSIKCIADEQFCVWLVTLLAAMSIPQNPVLQYVSGFIIGFCSTLFSAT